MHKTILLVEDYEDTRTVYKALLERRGYHVVAASSGAEALELAQEHKIDFLLSDLGLPDCDGCELLSKLLEIHKVPALAISGFGTDRDVERAKSAGFTWHLIKPVQPHQLTQIIGSALESA